MPRPKEAKDKKPRARKGSCIRIKMICKECNSDFILRKKVTNHNGLCGKCRQKVNVVAFRERHPNYTQTDIHKLKRRSWNLKAKYGITLEEYDAILEKQGGVCAICGCTENRGHSFCVDHNHNNGQVRGLLCHKCNQAIGLLDDRATKAAQYLLSRSRLDWDEYFMNLAVMVSTRSKDRSTKVGAVVVRDRVILSTGYNGFPRGINDDIEERHQRPLKYIFTCHAEENAITNAARIGAKVAGSDIYVTLHPCSGCAKIIIQSQIKSVFVLVSSYNRWNDDFKISRELLSEAGIQIIESGLQV